MAKDRDQKTEPQSAKRKKESRKKGEVAKSATLVSWLSLLVATYIIPSVARNVGDLVADGIRSITVVAEDPVPATLLAEAAILGRRSIGAVAPILIGAALLGLIGNLAQVGFIFTGGPLKPKFERISPAAGVKRLISIKSLWESGKQVLIMGVILAVSIPAVIGMANTLLGSTWALRPALSQLFASIMGLVQLIAIIGTVIGAVDYAWQRFNLLRDNRMTKEEVKKEARESEGDPHVKAKLRSNRLAMSRNSMLASVGDADVVITNPTHVAIALRYDPSKGAPRVLARGANGMAARIRARATEEGVALVESPPLARALYRSTRVDDEIPAALFQAVATVLAFVRRLEGRALAGARHTVPVPDSWTPPGEDPETSLAWRPTRRSPGRRRSSGPGGGPRVRAPGRAGDVPVRPTLIPAGGAPIDPGSRPRHGATGIAPARTPSPSKGS